MAIARSEIRKDILDRPCKKCGEAVLENDEAVLSFYRGEFIMLHEKCSDFIETVQNNKPLNQTEAAGGKASWPRDAFEALLDYFEERRLLVEEEK